MAIEQHPIPQDVAGYKFRLIGEMTIKQFAFLASGIVLALIIWNLPLPFFFKYPLAAIAVGLGAGIAFIPIEGRPMDKWLVAFIKSIYSPTEYVWQKLEEVEVVTPKAMPATSKPTTPVVSPQPVPQTPSVAAAMPAIPQPSVSPVPTPRPVSIPEEKPIQVTPSAPPTSPSVPKPEIAPPKPATPATNLPIPFTPTAGNTLVGMTLTPEGKILDGVLIEIKTNNISQRATKSNQLGQFLFAKPLENGLYQIFTEKPGYLFDTYTIDLRGQIVKPLKLQAKAHA